LLKGATRYGKRTDPTQASLGAEHHNDYCPATDPHLRADCARAGGLFWTGNALTLLPVHMLAGIVLVLALWTLALLAAVSGIHRGFVALAMVWGLIVPILGMTQNQLLPGALHWMIQILHLLIGIVAMSLGNGLAHRIKQAQTLAHQADESGPV
jgi:hypothetical protein